MRNQYQIVIMLLGLSSCGNGRAPDCATAVGKLVDGPDRRAYVETVLAASHSAPDSPAVMRVATERLWDAQAPAIKTAIAKRCVEDRWSQETISCVSKTNDANFDCGLTPAQKNALKNMPSE